MQKLTQAIAARTNQRFSYAWVVVGLIFLVLLTSAGIRATPSVMILPLEHDFGWNRSTISLAISFNIALYGLIGPFAAAAMQRFGIRPVVIGALALLSVGTALSTLMTMPWHMLLTWGLLVGSSTGVAANTLGATIVSRWFEQRRGLAMGLLTASAATGQMVFLPLMASMVGHFGWRSVAFLVAGVAAVAIPLVALFLPERPADVGLRRYGEAADAPADAAVANRNPLAIAFDALRRAVRIPDFWLLFFSFFICGLSTNGYIGTQFIAMCNDYGIDEVGGASILAAMGMLDLVGTTLSGWLSDRFNPRVLLFWYYGLRGLALIFLPYAFGLQYFGLTIFAIFYGLDWIATVPPTVALCARNWGTRWLATIFGLVFLSHQVGGFTGAWLGGLIFDATGSYDLMWSICIAAAAFAALVHLPVRDGAPKLAAATA